MAAGFFVLGQNQIVRAASPEKPHLASISGDPAQNAKISGPLSVGKFASQAIITTTNALNFDGSDDVVDSGNLSALTGVSQYTIEAWVKFDSFTNLCTVWAKRVADSDQAAMLQCRSNTGQIAIAVNGGYGYTADALSTGVWYHIAAVYDGSQLTDAGRLKLYVDGVARPLTFLGTVPPATPVTASRFTLGTEYNSTTPVTTTSSLTAPFDGTIDELRLWSTALTQTQIQANKDIELSGSEPNLEVYYPFNQGSGGGENTGLTTVNDIAGSAENGELWNFALTGAASNWVTSDAIVLPVADLQIAKTVTPTVAIPGSSITFTLAFSNTGPDTATNVRITDAVPTNMSNIGVTLGGVAITDTGAVTDFIWQVQDLATGQSGVITLTGRLNSPLAGGSFTNTATITGSTLDAVPGNNRSSAGVTVDTMCALQTEIPAAECQALVALYSATNGDSWYNNSNWLQTDTPCSSPWYGVWCSGGNVTGLYYYYNNLAGTIPAELANLSQLQYLELSSNYYLTGTIPISLANLSQLQTLDLRWNRLSGPVPVAFTTLPQLTSLSLSGNQLTGTIPPELGDMAFLQNLYLGSNQLTGTIPAELGNLATLRTLYLGSNPLTGTIPLSLTTLPLLEELDASYNNLSGPVPPELSDLPALKYLYLGGNHFTGTVPSEFSKLSTLLYLSLSSNQLVSPIPYSLTTLPLLEGLDLSYNNLDGPLPPELSNLSNLRWLYLNNNSFTGTLPLSLTTFSQLETLQLGSNELSGSIPAEMSNLPQLSYLSLYNNDFTGPIPPELGNLSNLRDLQLGSNQLTGTLPISLASPPLLDEVDLSYNNLTGPIPPEWGNMSTVRYIYLPGNQLTGPIPPELGNLGNLRWLYLNNNRLTGTIPVSLTNLSQLLGLYLDSNQMTGDIPVELTNMAGLYNDWGLGIAYNGLQADDSGLRAFLDQKNIGWESSQTIPPVVSGAINPGMAQMEITWDPISYTTNGGYFQVWYALQSGGPYTMAITTTNKSAGSAIVTGLKPDTTHHFVVSTFTPAGYWNQNAITSTFSNEVTATTLAPPNVGIVKSVMPNIAGPGEPLAYTLSFSNSGDVVATGVVITDIIPFSVTNLSVVSSGVSITNTGAAANFVWQVQNLAPGQGGAITITGQVRSGLRAGQITNTVNITATSLDAVTTNNRATATLTVVERPFLELSKTVDRPDPSPGTLITYTLVATNTGTAIAYNTFISDTLPAELIFAGPVTLRGATGSVASNAGDLPVLVSNLTLNPQQQITVTFPVTLNGSLPSSALVTNTASISSSDVSAPAVDSAAVMAVHRPDLLMSGLSVTPLSVCQGETVNVQFDALNQGQLAAGTHQLFYYDDAIATGLGTHVGTTTLPGLAAGGSSHFNLPYPAVLPGTRYFKVLADGGGVINEGNETNNSAVVSFTVQPDEAPSGSMVINNGDNFTGNRTVSLAISASDPAGSCQTGVKAMRFAYNGLITAWEPYNTTKSLTLLAIEGEKVSVSVQFRDYNNNVGIFATDNIIFENQPPDTHVNGPGGQTTATSFTVRWSGTDSGSGLKSYDVQVQDNNGGWNDWQSNTTATSAQFSGALAGHTYCFRSRGQDIAGNVESYPGNYGDTCVTVRTLASGIDLAVENLEFTQAIQNPGNTTPLIAGRPLLVRLTVGLGTEATPIEDVTARLRVFRNGVELSGSPLMPENGPITANPNPNPDSASDLLHFKLPQAWLQGELKLYAELDPANAIAESDETNNRFPAGSEFETLTFNQTNDLEVTIVPVIWEKDGQTYRVTTAEMLRFLSFIKRTYPVANIRPRIHVAHRYAGSDIDWAQLLEEIEGIRRSEQPNLDSHQKYYGLIPFPLSDTTGITAVGFKPGATAIGFNLPGNGAGQVAAQALGYTFGRGQVDGNGAGCSPAAAPDVNYPYPSGVTYYPGWDFSQGVVSGTVADFMADCPSVWVSDYTYQALYRPLATSLASLGLVYGQSVENGLLITGQVNNISQNGQLNHVFALSNTAITQGFTGGEFRVTLINQANVEVYVHTFDTQNLSKPGLGSDTTAFSFVVPTITGQLSKVRLYYQQNLLDELTLGAQPVVTITSPVPGVLPNPYTLTWESSPPNLTYFTRFSPDNGQNWVTLGPATAATSYEVDFNTLPGSSAGIFQVVASAGLNSASAFTPPFEAPNHPPEPVILSPEQTHFAPQEGIVFNGVAYDLEDGQLADNQLVWTSSKDGVLGNGGTLLVKQLSTGAHVITLQATDSDSNATEVQTSISVGGASSTYLPLIIK